MTRPAATIRGPSTRPASTALPNSMTIPFAAPIAHGGDAACSVTGRFERRGVTQRCPEGRLRAPPVCWGCRWSRQMLMRGRTFLSGLRFRFMIRGSATRGSRNRRQAPIPWGSKRDLIYANGKPVELCPTFPPFDLHVRDVQASIQSSRTPVPSPLTTTRSNPSLLATYRYVPVAPARRKRRRSSLSDPAPTLPVSREVAKWREPL